MSKSKLGYTGLFSAENSFLDGFARALDLGGTYDRYDVFSSPEEADRAAIAADWYAVGADLHRAIDGHLARVSDEAAHARSVK